MRKQDYNYINSYNKEHYDRVLMIFRKDLGIKQSIKEYCKKHNTNPSELFAKLFEKHTKGM